VVLLAFVVGHISGRASYRAYVRRLQARINA
jgi:hypothetical protein